MPTDIKSYELETLDSGSIILTVEGGGTISTEGDQSLNLQKGSVLFIAANDAVTLNNVDSKLLMFRAYCEL